MNMLLEKKTRDALIDIGFLETSLNDIETYQPLVDMLNQFVASYGDVGSPFQISNPGENYSYYDPKSGSISIYSNLINSIHDDYGQYKAVIVLAHEVSHALSDIKPDASSVYTYARSRNLDEGEAIYHEFLALYNIYPEIKEYRRDLWRDNESDFTLNPDNNIYDEVKRIVLGSASEQEKISQCAKINTEIGADIDKLV